MKEYKKVRVIVKLVEEEDILTNSPISDGEENFITGENIFSTDN